MPEEKQRSRDILVSRSYDLFGFSDHVEESLHSFHERCVCRIPPKGPFPDRENLHLAVAKYFSQLEEWVSDAIKDSNEIAKSPAACGFLRRCLATVTESRRVLSEKKKFRLALPTGIDRQVVGCVSPGEWFDKKVVHAIKSSKVRTPSGGLDEVSQPWLELWKRPLYPQLLWQIATLYYLHEKLWDLEVLARESDETSLDCGSPAVLRPLVEVSRTIRSYNGYRATAKAVIDKLLEAEPETKVYRRPVCQSTGVMTPEK